MTKLKLIIYSIMILSLSSCLTNGLASIAVDKARFKDVPDGYNFVIYDMKTKVSTSISTSSTARPEIITPNYSLPIRELTTKANKTAARYNFKMGNSTNVNCLLNVTDIIIKEKATRECEKNKDGQTKCFTLNGIDVTIKGYFTVNDAKHEVEAEAYDATSIRTAVIGGDLMETLQTNLDKDVVTRAYDKLIGKCTNIINKK